MSTAPPTTKRSRLKRSEIVAIVVAGIGAMAVVLAAVIPIVIDRASEPTPPLPPTPSSTSPVPGPIPTTSATIPSQTSATETPPPSEPTGVTVRRSTGKDLLTISDGYTADLDSRNPAWDVKYDRDYDNYDIELYHGGLSGNDTDFAIVSGQPSYETCQNATAYAEEISRDDIEPSISACVRTTDKRYAFITFKKVVHDPDKIQLAVVVWDPPFEE
jgi:hypothetical protein